jgi:hypothetical protein
MQASEIFASGALPHALLPSHHARHLLSRRAFVGGAAAGVTGAALGANLLWPATGWASPAGSGGGAAPKPTTNITTVGGVDFHFTFFGADIDPTSITDFTGLVGVADVQGTGTGTNPDGSTESLLFDSDMRFMKGRYIGKDGAVHRGAFEFV